MGIGDAVKHLITDRNQTACVVLEDERTAGNVEFPKVFDNEVGNCEDCRLQTN